MPQDNLEYALDLLLRLNGLLTKDGRPIYDVWRYEHYSIWSFFQQDLFWTVLRPFAQIKGRVDCMSPEDADTAIRNLVISNKDGIRSRLSLLISSQIARWWSRLSIAITFKNCPRVLLYTPDKYNPLADADFRFVSVYKVLRAKKQPYFESFHTLFGREFYKNFVARHRRCFYLDPFKFDSNNKGDVPEFDLSTLDASEKTLFKYILTRVSVNAVRSKHLIHALIHLLGRMKIRKFIAMDDVRYTNELVIACRYLGIPTYGIQHGHFTKYLVGYMNYGIPANRAVTFDRLYVWNDYWKRVLLDYSTHYNDENVSVGGPLRPPRQISLPKVTLPEAFSGLQILIASEPLSNKQEVGRHIDAFIDKDARVLLSVRPDASLKGILRDYKLKYPEKITLVTEVTEEVLRTTHIVAGTYSTFLNDMMAYDKPVVVLKTSLSHGHRLVEDGLACLADVGDDTGIMDYLRHWSSKKQIVWPTAPDLTDTLTQLLSDQPLPRD